MAANYAIASQLRGIPIGIGASGYVLRNGNDSHEVRGGEASATSGTANGGVASHRLGFSREPTPVQQRQAQREERARPATADDIVVSLGAQLAAGDSAYPATTVYGRDGQVAPAGSFVAQQETRARGETAVPPGLTFRAAATHEPPAPTGADIVSRLAVREAALVEGGLSARIEFRPSLPSAPAIEEARNGPGSETDRQRQTAETQRAEPRSPLAELGDFARQRVARAYAPPAQSAEASVNLFA